MISHLPVCFVWAFLPKFRSVTVHYSQSHSHSEYTHQSITWKNELSDTPAMQVRHTNIFLLFFCLCKRPHLFPQNTNPSHLRGGRESRQPKGAIPRCHQCYSQQRGKEQQVTSCRSSLQQVPRMANNTGTHSLPSPPHCQPKPRLIFPRPFTRGLLKGWFSEGKNMRAKQRLW